MNKEDLQGLLSSIKAIEMNRIELSLCDENDKILCKCEFNCSGKSMKIEIETNEYHFYKIK